jgi:hypothetical protein
MADQSNISTSKSNEYSKMYGFVTLEPMGIKLRATMLIVSGSSTNMNMTTKE